MTASIELDSMGAAPRRERRRSLLATSMLCRRMSPGGPLGVWGDGSADMDAGIVNAALRRPGGVPVSSTICRP
eukprot:CAMPEP_0175971904 /NCGR_PEP_ID=MMETSP0108-20121206/41920_1 /TAXON_ID=195067 ORGANISM="Goniomonas pacifica, Strain CCMP1869" /NCGR_SAMPLE_ID=MMETSP0108 /ASSEMBLY_ACC=CAM_ASM_000204 /LENGTH=72 /DNA_ID=CAMNT_0017301137 /DNA_START=28 /DNA_END=242 /DNA_ORIENTATION=+